MTDDTMSMTDNTLSMMNGALQRPPQSEETFLNATGDDERDAVDDAPCEVPQPRAAAGRRPLFRT